MTPIATLDGDASAIAGTPGAVYVALPRGLDTVLERRDPTTGRVLARATVPHGTSGGYGWTSLAASGDAVWLLTGKLHEYLVRLDPANLRIEQTQLLPHPAQGLAATVGGVWVGTGDRVVFHPASTGAALRSVTMPGATARVAVSPDQTSVYVSLSGPVRHNEDPLLQLDAATGAILARTYDGEADLDGYTSLAPTGDGIWFSVATGMQGGMSLLRAGTLAPVAKWAIRGSNKIVGTFAHDRLWVSDYRRMTCNDPQTGKTLGYAGFPDRDGAAVVQAGTDVLTVLGRTLYRIDPSLAC